MSWKEMIQVERGADITEMEAPIPSTIGEGFTFCLNGKQYTTIGGYTKGKRDVEFYITSYIGYLVEQSITIVLLVFLWKTETETQL